LFSDLAGFGLIPFSGFKSVEKGASKCGYHAEKCLFSEIDLKSAIVCSQTFSKYDRKMVFEGP
jgi:hypothetical protein